MIPVKGEESNKDDDDAILDKQTNDSDLDNQKPSLTQ
jgi:hypothetical protein